MTYLRQQPTVQDAASPPASHPPPRPRRTNRVAWTAAILAVLAAAGWAGFAYASRGTDAGVKGCQILRDGFPPNADRQQVRHLRELFATSGHADLREHGVAMLDLSWQVSQLKNPSQDVHQYVRPLTEAGTRLHAACANHGAALPAI